MVININKAKWIDYRDKFFRRGREKSSRVGKSVNHFSDSGTLTGVLLRSVFCDIEKVITTIDMDDEVVQMSDAFENR